jgi:hypothetical protein
MQVLHLARVLFLTHKPYSVYNDAGSIKRHFSAHLPGSVFSLTRNLFSATKVRARDRSMELQNEIIENALRQQMKLPANDNLYRPTAA